MQSHYAGIAMGYGLATAVVWFLWAATPAVIKAHDEITFERPWASLGLIVLAVAATLGIGQLYVRHLLLPEPNVLFQALNQALIFAPIVIVAALHKQRLASGGAPFGFAMVGLPIGAVLAVAALTAYAYTRGLGGELLQLTEFVLRTDNVGYAVQVLLEDLAIAALALRLRGVIGTRWTVVAVAVLFAVGHIPALLAGGDSIIAELPSLGVSVAIGLMVMGAVLATRSIWWVWPVHTSMDITQLYPG